MVSVRAVKRGSRSGNQASHQQVEAEEHQTGDLRLPRKEVRAVTQHIGGRSLNGFLLSEIDILIGHLTVYSRDERCDVLHGRSEQALGFGSVAVGPGLVGRVRRTNQAGKSTMGQRAITPKGNVRNGRKWREQNTRS